MKLSTWARKNGISYRTAYSWFKAGRIKNARQMDNGTIMVDEKDSKDVRELIIEMMEMLKEIRDKLK